MHTFLRFELTIYSNVNIFGMQEETETQEANKNPSHKRIFVSRSTSANQLNVEWFDWLTSVRGDLWQKDGCKSKKGKLY